MKKLTLFLITLAVCLGQAIAPAPTTYSSLPTASTVPNQLRTVTDCSTSACTAGGGSIRAVVQSTGSAWAVVGGGGTASIQLPGGVCKNGSDYALLWDYASAATGVTSGCLAATALEYAQISDTGSGATVRVSRRFILPQNFAAGNITLRLYTTQISNTSGTGNIGYKAAIYCASTTTAMNSVPTLGSYGSGSTTTPNQYILKSVSMTIDASGCSAGQWVWLAIERDNSVGSNYAAVIQLVDGEITYGL